MGEWKGDRDNINRAGRPPKGQALTDILRDQSEREDVGSGESKIARREAIAQKLWQMALNGDIQAMKYIYDRLDGRPKESVSMEHFNGVTYIKDGTPLDDA